MQRRCTISLLYQLISVHVPSLTHPPSLPSSLPSSPPINTDLKNEPHGKATWGSGNAKTDWNTAAEVRKEGGREGGRKGGRKS